MTTNLGDIIDRADAGAQPAVIEPRVGAPARRWTLAAMGAAADAIARGLVEQGFATGDRVAIIAGNRAEYLQAYLGIMRAGLAAVPVNQKLPPSTIAFILADAGVRGAFVDDDCRHLAPTDLPAWSFDAPEIGGLMRPGSFDAHAMAPDAIAQILYTSGSTGRPKGVPLTHDGQLWSLRKMDRPAAADESIIVAAPLCHMNGLLFSKIALRNKITLVLMPRFEAAAYLRAVAEHRCTIASGIPTMFALLARERSLTASLDLGSVRTAMMGSAPLTETLVDDVRAVFPNAAIWNGYGTTEAGPFNFGPHPDGLPRPPLSIGCPYPDVEYRLVGPRAPDEGVLQVRTRATMTGYLNLPEETAKRLSNGWYDTGDILRRDADGFFYFVGRADDMFVCGGENVYPGEVEKLLEAHPGVAQAIVVPADDPIKGQIPIAFVVARPDTALSEEVLKAYSLREGPAYRHPRRVIVTDALPLAGPGKIDRRALSAAAQQAACDRPARAG